MQPAQTSRSVYKSTTPPAGCSRESGGVWLRFPLMFLLRLWRFICTAITLYHFLLGCSEIYHNAPHCTCMTTKLNWLAMRLSRAWLHLKNWAWVRTEFLGLNWKPSATYPNVEALVSMETNSFPYLLEFSDTCPTLNGSIWNKMKFLTFSREPLILSSHWDIFSWQITDSQHWAQICSSTNRAHW